MTTATAPLPTAFAAVTADERFQFDNQGFLHVRGALGADEVADALAWADEAKSRDLAAIHAWRGAEALKQHLNRSVSCVIDVEPRFLRFVDHPAIARLIAGFCGEDFKHIDNDLLDTVPGFGGGGWHRGVPAHRTGYCEGGRFACPMVKVFFCLTDVGPEQGPFEVVPGSHKGWFASEEDVKRLDLPGQHVFGDVRAGDAIVFNEALLHNGRPNRTELMRRTLVVNFGGPEARAWTGYHPAPETLARATPRQRRILTNLPGNWSSPVIEGQIAPATQR